MCVCMREGNGGKASHCTSYFTTRMSMQLQGLCVCVCGAGGGGGRVSRCTSYFTSRMSMRLQGLCVCVCVCGGGGGGQSLHQLFQLEDEHVAW